MNDGVLFIYIKFGYVKFPINFHKLMNSILGTEIQLKLTYINKLHTGVYLRMYIFSLTKDI